MIDFRNIPQKLKDTDSWVVWYKGFYEGHLKKNPVNVPIEAWSADWNTYPVKPYLEARESLKQYRKENPTYTHYLTDPTTYLTDATQLINNFLKLK